MSRLKNRSPALRVFISDSPFSGCRLASKRRWPHSLLHNRMHWPSGSYKSARCTIKIKRGDAQARISALCPDRIRGGPRANLDGYKSEREISKCAPKQMASRDSVTGHGFVASPNGGNFDKEERPKLEPEYIPKGRIGTLGKICSKI